MTTAREFTNRLADLLRRERDAMADFLVLLADFDQRRLWVELGHASLFSFLHRELGVSRGAAYYRKTAAELVQRFPEVVEPLRDGRLCITSVVELAKVMSTENRAEVLPRFFHCSKQEAAEVAAAIRPDAAAPRREVVTAVRAAAPALFATAEDTSPRQAGRTNPPAGSGVTAGTAELNRVPVQLEGRPDANSAVPAPSFLPAPQRERERAEPLTADLRRFHVTVSKAFLKKLDAARSALSHSRPGATAEQILEAGLDLLLAREATTKRAEVEKPLATPPPSSPEHVPAHVRREVWKRDGGCCQWRLDGGGPCGSTFMLELDHIQPRALGGLSTVENLRLLCRFHNRLAARRAFGDAMMDRYARPIRPADTEASMVPAIAGPSVPTGPR